MVVFRNSGGEKMIISTTDKVPEKEVRQVLGVVKGNTIRAMWFG